MDSWIKHITKLSTRLPVIRLRLPKIMGSSRYLTNHTQGFLNFISNDYLGLSTDPRIIDALVNACKTYGLGSGGAPSLGGYSEEHQLLTEELAKWLGYEKCLLFSSGYQLNIGLFSQLVDSNTTVWFDRRCHASHIDGIMLAKAKFVTFNEDSIDEIIFKITSQPHNRHLILSEGSFSMDGTCSYWKKLIQLKQSNSEMVLLIIDDAHGIGALGANGHGTLEQIGLNLQHIDLIIGTFGKAFGTHGGFICGTAKFIDYLQQSVRTQIFSTNLPPGIAAASRAGLMIIDSPEGRILRARLVENINYFGQLATESGLRSVNYKINQSPIQLLVYNDEQRAMHIHNYLLRQNILVGKIFYPTVPKTKPRLRISLNIEHKKSDLKALVSCLRVAEKLL